MNLENVEEFLHFLIERPAKTQRRRISLWICPCGDTFYDQKDLLATTPSSDFRKEMGSDIAGDRVKCECYMQVGGAQ